MFMSNPEHFLIIARPIRPVPITAMVLPVTASPRNGRNGCNEGHVGSRTSRSLCHIFLASMLIIKNANSAVASVSTSAVFVNGILYLFFFLQAEDGIRDGHVTGVQTCALPIYDRFVRRIFAQEVLVAPELVVAV